MTHIQLNGYSNIRQLYLDLESFVSQLASYLHSLQLYIALQLTSQFTTNVCTYRLNKITCKVDRLKAPSLEPPIHTFTYISYCHSYSQLHTFTHTYTYSMNIQLQVATEIHSCCVRQLRSSLCSHLAMHILLVSNQLAIAT